MNQTCPSRFKCILKFWPYKKQRCTQIYWLKQLFPFGILFSVRNYCIYLGHLCKTQFWGYVSSRRERGKCLQILHECVRPRRKGKGRTLSEMKVERNKRFGFNLVERREGFHCAHRPEASRSVRKVWQKPRCAKVTAPFNLITQRSTWIEHISDNKHAPFCCCRVRYLFSFFSLFLSTLS